jgi:phosphoglycerate dehydrogenase-like enzyme
MLRNAGFDIVYPKNPIFTRGLGSEEEAIDELSVCDAVIAGGEHVTARTLASLPKLRVVSRLGVGYDRVDVAAATQHKVAVTITPNANYECVAEQALAHMLAVAKSLHFFHRELRAGKWTRFLTVPLRGRTLGIVGLGRVGRALTTRALAMGMKVIAYETYPNREFLDKHAVELLELDTLLTQSDFVSVHCPANNETKGMFNQDLFAKMKKGAFFINTARGALVVEEHLIAALESGHLGGAGLDVFEEEPTSSENPLLKFDNVSLTPHVGGEDTLASEMMACEAAENILKLHRGEWPAGTALNNELRDGWKW